MIDSTLRIINTYVGKSIVAGVVVVANRAKRFREIPKSRFEMTFTLLLYSDEIFDTCRKNIKKMHWLYVHTSATMPLPTLLLRTHLAAAVWCPNRTHGSIIAEALIAQFA